MAKMISWVQTILIKAIPIKSCKGLRKNKNKQPLKTLIRLAKRLYIRWIWLSCHFQKIQLGHRKSNQSFQRFYKKIKLFKSLTLNSSSRIHNGSLKIALRQGRFYDCSLSWEKRTSKLHAYIIRSDTSDLLLDWGKDLSQTSKSCQENEDHKKNQKFARLDFDQGGHFPNLQSNPFWNLKVSFWRWWGKGSFCKWWWTGGKRFNWRAGGAQTNGEAEVVEN